MLLTALLIASLSDRSSIYLSTERLRAFMKKLTTVETLSPSCSAIVAWISLLGRLISLKIATRVRRCISVKTIRGFLVVVGGGPLLFSGLLGRQSLVRLQAGILL